MPNKLYSCKLWQILFRCLVFPKKKFDRKIKQYLFLQSKPYASMNGILHSREGVLCAQLNVELLRHSASLVPPPLQEEEF